MCRKNEPNGPGMPGSAVETFHKLPATCSPGTGKCLRGSGCRDGHARSSGTLGQPIVGCRTPKLEPKIESELLCGSGRIAAAAAHSGAVCAGGACR